MENGCLLKVANLYGVVNTRGIPLIGLGKARLVPERNGMECRHQACVGHRGGGVRLNAWHEGSLCDNTEPKCSEERPNEATAGIVHETIHAWGREEVVSCQFRFSVCCMLQAWSG